MLPYLQANTFKVLIGIAACHGELKYALRVSKFSDIELRWDLLNHQKVALIDWHGVQLLEDMQERSIPMNIHVQRALLSCFASAKQSQSALQLLDEMIMSRTQLDTHIFTETM